MGHRLSLAAPVRNPLRRKRVPKIHQPQRAAFATGDQIVRQSVEDSLGAARRQRAAGRADKQGLTSREVSLTHLVVTLKGSNGGRMQGNDTFGAKLAPANTQRVLSNVEVTPLEAQRLARSHARGREQPNQRLISQWMQQ